MDNSKIKLRDHRTIAAHDNCIIIGSNIKSKCNGHILIKLGHEVIVDMVMSKEQQENMKSFMGGRG